MMILDAIDINILSFVILALIYYNAGKRVQRGNLQYRIFAAMILSLGITLAFDTAQWIMNGVPGPLSRALNLAFTVLLYLPVPVVVSLYALYTDYQVFHDEKRLPRLCRALAVYALLDQIFLISSIWTGWAFAIDAENRYQRGPYVAAHTLAAYAVLLYTFLFVLRNRNRIDPRQFVTLLTFGLPPALAGILQSLTIGLELSWSGMTLSILLLYLNIQDKNLETDALTGIYNRRLLDSLVEDKVKSSSRGKTFSAILIDLDDFKQINDNFGHGTGDEALLDTVGLLKGCLRHGDLITRYGGDEFLIILDIVNPNVLKDTVERIENSFGRFNRGGSRPYQLQISTGYAVYDMSSGMDPEQFIQHIDSLMYANKKQRRDETA